MCAFYNCIEYAHCKAVSCFLSKGEARFYRKSSYFENEIYLQNQFVPYITLESFKQAAQIPTASQVLGRRRQYRKRHITMEIDKSKWLYHQKKGRKREKDTNKRRDLIKPSTNFVIRGIKVLLKASSPKIQYNKEALKVASSQVWSAFGLMAHCFSSASLPDCPA